MAGRRRGFLRSPKMPGSIRYRVALLVTCGSLAICVGQNIHPVIFPVIDGSDIRFNHVFFGTGPAHSKAHRIVQDRMGFLWFATADRLQRYDGYDVREYRQPLTDPNVFIQGLFEDKMGTLWVYRDRGIGRDKVPFGALDRYDPSSGIFAPVQQRDPWFEAPIADINQDHNGSLWFSTSEGLFRMDSAGGILRYRHNPKDPSSLSSDVIRSTFEASDGSFWVTSSSGLDLFDRKTAKVIQRIPLPANFPSPKRAEELVIRLCEDHYGVLWAVLTYGHGLARIDRQAGKFIFYSLDGAGTDDPQRSGARAIQEDRSGALWIGTVFSGIFKFEPDRKRFIRYRNHPSDPESLSGDAILDMLEDREGNMWVGTNDGGIDRFPTHPLPFRRYRHEDGNPNSLDTSYTTTVFEDSHDILWVGSRRALGALDRKTGRLTFYRKTGGPGELSDPWIYSVAEDRSGDLWFGTLAGGLNRFDRRTQKFNAYRHNPADSRTIVDNRVIRVFIDHKGVLWIGTDKGLDAFDPVTRSFQHYLSGSRVRDIAEDSQGVLWIAARAAGLVRFDPSTGQSAVYHPSSDKAWAVTLDHTGMLWVGTETGLNRFDPATQNFTAYYESDGLPDNSVSHILEDERGDLWISTHNGLSRFDRKTFKNYYVSDGLSGNEFYDFSTSFKSGTGEMFFSANGGLTAFFPREIVDDPAVPPVVITDFKIFGKESRLQTELTHTQNVLTFEFSTLSFTSPERNRYRYRLEPLENQWNESQGDRHSITYALSPGKYVFWVQGSNSRDLWNEQGASFGFVISPPWWSTWWFRAAAIAMLLISIGYGYYLHLQNIQRQFKIRFDERTRIARELHDTLLQSFHGLMLRFQAVDNMLPPGKAKETLEQAIDRAAQAITESRDAVQELRASTVSTDDLPAAVISVGKELAADSLAKFRVEVLGTPRNLQPIFRDEVYRIASEALRNAFCHADASSILLQLQYSEGELRLRVQDDGKGIDPKVAEKNGHFGLAGMRERAALLGGRLEIWSKPQEGTEVDLRLPLNRKK